jgi:hypothetical protein
VYEQKLCMPGLRSQKGLCGSEGQMHCILCCVGESSGLSL